MGALHSFLLYGLSVLKIKELNCVTIAVSYLRIDDKIIAVVRQVALSAKIAARGKQVLYHYLCTVGYDCTVLYHLLLWLWHTIFSP